MHKDDIDDVLRRKVAPSVNSDVAYDVGDVWELLENIFCVKNDGNDIRGGSGSVGRMGRRGGGEPGVALDGIGRTMEAENGLKSCSLDDGGRIESIDAQFDRSDVTMFGLGEEGLTTAVVVVGTGVEDDLGGEL